MNQSQPHESSLLVPKNFIRAIRESGYVNLATALAELVDNSLQAGATQVAIDISRDAPNELPTIAIEDNGVGMTREELADCLRFGGSARFDSRSSFGRFGMGLPAASLSQARKVEVTAWSPGSPAQAVSLDVDAVAGGQDARLELRPGQEGASSSGCIVKWSHCDRIEYQRLGWLDRSLRRELGRIFRRFLARGFDLTINGKKVHPVDPMLLSTKFAGHSGQLAFEPLRYEIATTTGESSFVEVSFAILPVGGWHHLDNATKRKIGVVGHGGVSILRAGREIASGWYFMGTKRKENYDDWWRCEIEFEPALDEQFGITVNKQGVRPTAALREALEPELESIARLLNSRVRQAFEEIKFKAAVQGSCRIARDADAELPVVRAAGRGIGALNYHLGTAQLPGTSMFDMSLKQRSIDVTMNVDHPGYLALYRPLHDMGESATPVRIALELFFLSFARSVTTMGAGGIDYRNLLRDWGSVYGRMLHKS